MVERSQGQGRLWKRNRNRHGRGKATKVQRDYIMGCVLVPALDCRRAQLLDTPREIHILDHLLVECATQSPENGNLWRNPWGPRGPLQGPAFGCRVSQSAKIMDPGCWRTLGKNLPQPLNGLATVPTLHYLRTT
jgi:hypothetical protein